MISLVERMKKYKCLCVKNVERLRDMEKLDGIAVMEKLKKIEDFNTPVIALTADAVQGAKDKYLKEGFNGYIAKPFTRDQIKEKLDKILN